MRFALLLHTLLSVTLLITTQSAFSQQRCIDIFIKSKSVATQTLSESDLNFSLFIDQLNSDPYTARQLDYIQKQLSKTGQLNSPIEISRTNSEFRRQILPILLYEPSFKEAAIKFMEAELRIKSAMTKKIILSKRAAYDVVILGAGVHGTIALQSLLATNPKLRVLIIDEADTGGSNFRYPNNAFNINSSNRPSGEGLPPLPGQGNINELPLLPIQVSDLTAVKYPTAGDLGAALVTGLYSGVRQSPKVDVLFLSQLQSIVENGSLSRYRLEGQFLDSRTPFSLNAERVILASGLGAPRIPDSIRKSIEEDPRLVQSANPLNKLPKVMTFEDIIKILGQSENPQALLNGKSVAVVGTGDSANVLIEFLLGYAVQSGYGLSSAQTGRVDSIAWLGQSQKTCEDFIAEARSRYAQIGTGFRSSDPNAEPTITAYGEKLESIKMKKSDLELTLVQQPRKQQVTLKNVDHVILATGYEGELYQLFQKLMAGRKKSPLTSDEELIKKYFTSIEAATEVSGKEKTTVAKQFEDIIIVGPAAGKLPKKKELFGIIQNTVSIFNNAQRTDAAVEAFLKNISPKDTKETSVTTLNVLNRGASRYLITKSYPQKSAGAATEPLLRAIALAALNQFRFAQEESIKIKITNSAGNRLAVSSNYEIKELLETLAKTRDFFNMAKMLLTATTDKALVITADISRKRIVNKSLVLEIKSSNEGNSATTEELPNSQLPFENIGD